MANLVETARRARGSDLLPRISFGVMNAETLILKMADRIEELEAERADLTRHVAVYEDLARQMDEDRGPNVLRQRIELRALKISTERVERPL